MLKKCKCGCSDIRLCVITRITNNGKNRFEKFSHYCPNCGEESEQCSIEYPVEMTVRDYIPLGGFLKIFLRNLRKWVDKRKI